MVFILGVNFHEMKLVRVRAASSASSNKRTYEPRQLTSRPPESARVFLCHRTTERRQDPGQVLHPPARQDRDTAPQDGHGADGGAVDDDDRERRAEDHTG